MTFHLVRSSRFRTFTFLKYLILQSAGQGNYTCFSFIDIQEFLSGFLIYFKFFFLQLHEVIVDHLLSFVITDFRGLTT